MELVPALPRRNLARLSAALAVAGVAAVGAAAPEKYRDWLDLRRGGASAVLADTRAHTAPVPWSATYAATLPAGHPLKDQLGSVRLTITRAAPSAPNLPGRTLVRFDEPAFAKGWGILVDGDKAWLRAGDKVEPTTAAKASQLLPKLGVAPVVFVASEFAAQFESSIEGEFGDTAVLRFKPRYEAGPDVLPLKAGLSKRHGAWVLGEVDDRKGQPLSRIEWLEPKVIGGVPVPEALRLHLPGGDAAAVTLDRVDLKVGDQVKWLGGPKGLK